jgi:hypothetical protein
MNMKQKPLTDEQVKGLVKWMQDNGLTYRGAGKRLGVSNVSLHKWIDGGGIHPAQRRIVIAAITGGPAPDANDIAEAMRELMDAKVALDSAVKSFDDAMKKLTKLKGGP